MSINAYILAGGKSSRMGEEKGLVVYNGKPLIQYVMDAVLPITEKIVVVSSHKSYEQFGYPLLADQIGGLGPAGAIDTLLHHSDTASNLVLACDMPYIDTVSLNSLIDLHKGDITVPLYHHYPEALLGIYNTSCKLKWHDLIAQGVLKLSELLSHFAVTFADGEKLTQQNPNLFRNLNAKDDLY